MSAVPFYMNVVKRSPGDYVKTIRGSSFFGRVVSAKDYEDGNQICMVKPLYSKQGVRLYAVFDIEISSHWLREWDNPDLEKEVE